jgi:endonuclease/exonuclease/phosphatase family metal-dependent hydrolase
LPTPSGASRTLSFSSFNTHFGMVPRGRAFDVVEACGRLGSDIIALQEVYKPAEKPSSAAEAASAHGYEIHELMLAPAALTPRVRIVRDPSEAQGSWGLALLVRMPARRLPDIPLGHAIADPAPRAALVVEIDVDGTPVIIATAHVSHRPHGSLMQLRRLEQALWTGVDSPAVLAGDMNMWGPVVSRSFPDWRRAVLGPTWPAHRPHSQIDHILVRGAVEIVSGGVGRALGSDHRPISVELRIHP